MRAGDLWSPLAALLGKYGLAMVEVAAEAPIPGSYWGAPEAGLRRDGLYARRDTPVHSVLHEAAHFICLDPARRRALDTDAGGSDLEECAVCYLQILLAGALPGMGQSRMLEDMDAWGYSFRLGSARAWFETDSAEARAWLLAAGLIEADGRPTYRRRES